MLFQQRPGHVANWPAWELDLLDAYFEHEPPVLERMETVQARLTSMYASVHREKGTPPVRTNDLLPHLNAWPDIQDGRYSDVDKEVLRAFMA